MKSKMQSLILRFLFFILAVSVAASAGTVAYWRFEEGPAEMPVSHPVAAGVYYAAIADSSGNGNELSVWNESWAGFAYQSDAAYLSVPQTGTANTFSIRNIGTLPSIWTNTSDPINSIRPSAFTIEATFKLVNGETRTIVGRDSYGTVTGNAALPALYFQALSNNQLAIKYCDVSGYWHQAVSKAGVFESFDNTANPNGIGVPWYSMAAVSDGHTLSLYLANHDTETGYWLIAQTDLTKSGSPNTALTSGAGDGGDWDAGNWTLARGLYNGGHQYRAMGLIDEVRISNSALRPSEFLGSPKSTNVAAYWRFEDGPENSTLRHPVSGGEYYPAIEDCSGNGNDLSVWDTESAGYIFTANLGFTRVNGLANNFSVRNNGPTPTMWTGTTDPIASIAPAAFTIEATFKLENGDYRTIVGRDSYGTASADAALSALYFQALPDNKVAIKFCDVSGYWHQAVSPIHAIQTFDYASNPTGDGVPWYSMAGISNGTTLSLYLRNVTSGGAWQLVAQTDLTASGSPNTALTAGAGDGSDWDAGSWTVGRGLFNGVHTDRACGFIDEVRISTNARGTAGLLYCEIPSGNNWMGQLNCNLSLSQISIPGTHDSGARYEPVSGTAKCQNLTIAEQLNAGIRILDIRCRHINDTFTIHHGSVYQNINFDDVLNAVYDFLNSHPAESVLMSVKEEYDASNTTRSFEATFDTYTQANPGKWYLKNTIPTISQARGKIVLLRRFGAGSLPKGIPAANWADNTTFWINNGSSQLRIQDYYNVSSASAKWNAILPILDEAVGGAPGVMYLNFTSGYKAGLFGIPSITTISNAINPQIISYFSSAPKGRFGGILMDFADAQKATLIYNTNFRIAGAWETADINGDGVVDMEDLGLFWRDWLRTPTTTQTDMHPDRFIDMNDFCIFSRFWGI